MRSLQVVMLTLCLVGGLYLIMQAPVFFLPERWDPAIGRQFDAAASRLLGAGLLVLAVLGAQYMHQMYYSARRRLPAAPAQRRYFLLVVLALALISAAMYRATPGPNPDYRAPGSARTP